MSPAEGLFWLIVIIVLVLVYAVAVAYFRSKPEPTPLKLPPRDTTLQGKADAEAKRRGYIARTRHGIDEL